MSRQSTDFVCLRCGHSYEGPYDPKVPEERACPECGSNSVRPMPGGVKPASSRRSAKPASAASDKGAGAEKAAVAQAGSKEG